jgi:hypothetical protein
MYATLSRATKSIKEKAPGVDHEVLLTEVFCLEAKERVLGNIAHMTSGSTASLDSKRVCLAVSLLWSVERVVTVLVSACLRAVQGCG